MPPLPCERLTVVLSFDVEQERDARALPQVAGLLQRYRVPAAFACIGRWVERYTAEHRNLVAAGMEVVNHSHTHPNHPDLAPHRRFDQLTAEEAEREVRDCHDACRALLGVSPTGFRTPHFGVLHTPLVYQALERLGYRYSSSTNACATASRGGPFRVGALWEFPLTGCPRHPLVPLDTWHTVAAADALHRRPGEFAALARLVLRHARPRGGFVNLYFDPDDALRHGLEDVLRALAHRGEGVRCVTYADLVRECQALCPTP